MNASGRLDDVIVIGSGIGGLAAAAALAKSGRRVLVVEQHFVLGGLTQTFSRPPYEFATGVHYLAGVGETPEPENRLGRMLHWLSDGRLGFAPVGSPYDIVRLPDLEFPIEAPREAYVQRLKASFPAESAAIGTYFAACDEARRAAMSLFASKALPAPLATLVRWLNSGRIHRALDVTSADAVQGIRDHRLRALLLARWGTYGLPPAEAPFAVHAMVMASYFPGAYFPIGGPNKFAETLGETIRTHGGELRTRATVADILVEQGHVSGVRLKSGETIAAPIVVSAMGARNTLRALPAELAPDWREAIQSLSSGVSHVTLYLGFRADIRRLGATPANVWIYEGEDIGRIWEHPESENAPQLFVSFPTLKDPAHADAEHHTGEVFAPCRWEPFAAWAESEPGSRSADYQAAKARIADTLLAQFARHFPRLAPTIDFHELSTPLSQAAYVCADRGAIYGIEMSSKRLRGDALRPGTPVPGLLLAGQDAVGPGIPGALMGGLMAAAAVEPGLWKELRA